jgi:hypothetical protein
MKHGFQVSPMMAKKLEIHFLAAGREIRKGSG